MSELERFYDILLSDNPEQLKDIFARSPLLNDPQAGHVAGPEALSAYADEIHQWLTGAHAEVVAVTEDAQRIVVEFVVHLLRDEKRIPLPVAVAGDKVGEALGTVRVYYSMWPLLGHHVIRKPIVCEDKNLEMPDVVGMYHKALRSGDLDGILDAFEDDGYAREPAGGPYLYQGKENLKEFYGKLFSNGGGILLDYCLLTDDGVRAALEYNALAWGRTELPPQAGIAVYERGPGGMLLAARIYDDVDPPV